MKKIVLALATVGALTASASSFAQTVGVGVTFEPEQRTRIKEYVVKERPVAIKERVTVGARLPADVELRAVPSDWGPSVSKYRYVYSDDRVYFVEPSSREVVHVLD
jgi:hypothetical protein